MSTVPWNSKNYTDKINNLIITREAGLTPHEPSISYDVYGTRYTKLWVPCDREIANKRRNLLLIAHTESVTKKIDEIFNDMCEIYTNNGTLKHLLVIPVKLAFFQCTLHRYLHITPIYPVSLQFRILKQI